MAVAKPGVTRREAAVELHRLQASHGCGRLLTVRMRLSIAVGIMRRFTVGAVFRR